MTTPIITPSGGYRRTLSFGVTCLVYHATTAFCSRNFDFKNAPLGKTAGQMIGAARSARQNLVEASARAGTSTETELRLLDVAKGSLQELTGDFEAFLLDRGLAPWQTDSPEAATFRSIRFAPFEPSGNDVRHDFGVHFLAMRARFAPFLEPEDPVAAANGILLAIDRASGLIRRQMDRNAEEFRSNGGFTERMSRARIETRNAPPEDSDAPRCPDCGAPMRQRLARKGENAGRPFWSCSRYPDCKGTRPC